MKTLPILVAMLLGLQVAGPALADEYRQLPGVIHLHSTFSSGKYTLEQLVEKARQKQLEVLIPTDHDLVVMQYGLFPLRNLLKRREERPSVLSRGPESYLTEIKRLNDAQDEVIILPGVQSSPYYYWTGHPLKKNLTAHDYRKELLLIGMQSAEDYRKLPLLHNGFSTRYTAQRLPQAVSFLMAIGIGCFLFWQKGRFRIIGAVVAAAGLLLLVDQHPFQSSRFDPYQGPQGIEPYQETIDYVGRRNGLVFWAHPESKYARDGVSLGPVTLMTKPYANDLLVAQNYTGFSAVYGDTSTAVDAGRHWDQILMQYCRRERDRPVWGIAGADFHAEKKGVALDTFQTVFLLRSKSAEAVREALAAGRMYAVRKESTERLVLDRFRIKDPGSGRVAQMGETLTVDGAVRIEGALSIDDSGRHHVEVLLIRWGKIWQRFAGKTPLAFEFVDRQKDVRKSYYRIVVHGRRIGKLVSNPIFVVNK